MNAAIAVVFAYLVGSIPFAFLLSRHHGVDLREAGSRNVGATNVLRTTGARAALCAVALDGAKGTAAVLVAEWLSRSPNAVVAAACASVVGHVCPVWLRFRGGKGVATAAGAFAMLAPSALGAAAGVFVLAVAATRFISVGSMAGAVTLAVVAAAGASPGVVAVGATASALVIVYRHRENVARLMAGTERRLGQRAVE